MTIKSNSNWDACPAPKEGLVSTANGTRLFLVSRGPPRQPGQPVVIFEAGLGVSSAGWAAVQRMLDPRIRSYRYDRAGYGHSPASAKPRTAASMAAELRDLLRAAGVAGPYILATHSYGGILVREFLALVGRAEIAGMVLVDANQENTHQKLRVPWASLEALSGGQRAYADIIGLTRKNSYTAAEIGRIALDESVPTASTTATAEQSLMLESSLALGKHQQLLKQPLGLKPVTVIRGDTGKDFRRLLSAVQNDGMDFTTREHVADMSEFLIKRFDAFDRDLQLQQLRLSGNGRFVQATKSGHAVPATEPDLIAKEILAIWKSAVEA